MPKGAHRFPGGKDGFREYLLLFDPSPNGAEGEGALSLAATQAPRACLQS